MSGKELLEPRWSWEVGDDRSINIWRDTWVASNISLENYIGSCLERADPFIYHSHRQWNLPLLREILAAEQFRLVMAKSLPWTATFDKLV